ncbi:hypothetical protein ACTFIY_003426 [Dictyostelium cf. discoideum]
MNQIFIGMAVFCRQSDLTFSLLEAPAVPHCLNQPLSKSDPLPLLTSRNFETPISNTCTIEIPKYPTVLPCSLVFHGRTHFNEILKFFHVGRQLLTNTRQRSLFILSAKFLIIPLLGYSLLAIPEDQDVMKTLSPKNNSEFEHIPTFAQYIL